MLWMQCSGCKLLASGRPSGKAQELLRKITEVKKNTASVSFPQPLALFIRYILKIISYQLIKWSLILF